MYKDVINYKLAEWVTPEHLYAVAQKVYDDWMIKQEWFIKREIHTDEDGEYFDLVYRASKEAMEKSNEAMADMPHSDERFWCYDMISINSKGISVQKSFG